MALLGAAALAMWWDIAPEVRHDFEHWHAHEHFPERLAIPGFRRASRWRTSDGGDGGDGGDGMFVLYELADHAVLASPAYAARLNAPSPWSARLMPHHRHMVRTQCRVEASHGALLGRALETVRLPVPAGADDVLPATVARLAASLAGRPGVVGVHLLRHETPALAATTEQQLRGLADRTADRVLLASGYDAAALAGFVDEVLAGTGDGVGVERGRHALALSAVPPDMA